ncbi:unnamed protein product [Rotaria sordida]|uniref:G-protein coupled receptors family 1 profile domain-containing protein n=1 Tax=Rotaria sordida TaxID=392033 RepID=A0A815M5A9_9BILA|nr:unnamed protein product [Rotaria sordida]CAF1444721.1 unnamed protein product [Rotaria sordida]CAF3971641.1 unnamed protein product [Rotaria sordida]CAF4041165.1 unnamed protein product [Rotaria sordida]
MSSSPSIVSSLANASQQITLYLGQSILIFGIIGGTLNLIVFLSLKTFRQSSCAFYLIIMSCVNIGQLVTGCLSRIMIVGYNIDWTQTSLFYCKSRWFFFQTFTLTSYACMCFAIIDQYLATSTYRRWQHWNNIKLAYCLCTVSFIFTILHGFPSIIYFNFTNLPTTNKLICTITNSVYQRYRTYGFNVFLAGALPVFTTVLFGSLAYRNVKHLASRTVPLVRRELDRQLTSMVLVQVVYISIAVVPYTTVIIIISNLDLQNKPILAAELQLAECLGAIIYYSYFAAPFYIYICASKRFRQQLIYVLCRIHANYCRKPTRINNQISPESQMHSNTNKD